MLHLKLASDVHDSDLLRTHIESNAEEIQAVIGDEIPLSVHVKRIAKDVFAIDFHTRLFGKMLVVSEKDSNLFQAVTRARRHLLRQIGDVRKLRLDKARRRSPRYAFAPSA